MLAVAAALAETLMVVVARLWAAGATLTPAATASARPGLEPAIAAADVHHYAADVQRADYREDGLIQSASTVEVLCRRQGELTAAEASQQNAPNRSAVLQPAAATALLRLLTRLLREDPASIV